MLLWRRREARTGSGDLSREVSSGPAGFRMQVAWFPGQNIPFSAGKHQAPALSWPSWGQPSWTGEFMETSFISHHKGWWPQPRPQGHTETSQVLRGKVGQGHLKSVHLYERKWAEREREKKKKSHLRRIFSQLAPFRHNIYKCNPQRLFGHRARDGGNELGTAKSWFSNTQRFSNSP